MRSRTHCMVYVVVLLSDLEKYFLHLKVLSQSAEVLSPVIHGEGRREIFCSSIELKTRYNVLGGEIVDGIKEADMING